MLLRDKSKIRDNIDVLNDLVTMVKVIGKAEAVRADTCTVTVFFAKPCAIRREITTKDASQFYYMGANQRWMKTKQNDIAVILRELHHFPNNRVTMVGQTDMKRQASMDPFVRY